MKIEKIVFATDFLEGSFQALHYAVDLTKRYDAKLYILHVIYDIAKATDSHIPHVSLEELYKEMSKWAQNEIGKCCIEDIRGLPDVEKVVLQGIPYEEILKFAEENKADMIIMGTQGRKSIERFIFGSTAERVVRNAPCPVMTVRIQD